MSHTQLEVMALNAIVSISKSLHEIAVVVKEKPGIDALRSMLEQMCDAAQQVVDNWERGDLAGSVNYLDGTITEARQLLGDG